MAKTRWLKRELLGVIMLDKPEIELQLHVYRITWLDGSQCIDPMKYARHPKRGDLAPYNPVQHLQAPTGIAADVFTRLAEIVAQAEPSPVRIKQEQLAL